jgi:hypothetical protein
VGVPGKRKCDATVAGKVMARRRKNARSELTGT